MALARYALLIIVISNLQASSAFKIDATSIYKAHDASFDRMCKASANQSFEDCKAEGNAGLMKNKAIIDRQGARLIEEMRGSGEVLTEANMCIRIACHYDCELPCTTKEECADDCKKRFP